MNEAVGKARDLGKRSAAVAMQKARAAWERFRRESKFFQYKVYIGAIYAALIVLTVIVIVPRGPSNKLQAYVLAARGDFVVGSYIMVRNDSRRDWTDVTLTLNGTHQFKAPALKRGEKVAVTLKKFTAKAGGPTLQESEVQLLLIETADGKEQYRVDFLKN